MRTPGINLGNFFLILQREYSNLRCCRGVCVCVGGGGGGGWGGGNFLYMAKYGCACRMAPFFSAARYMIGPLFSTKI